MAEALAATGQSGDAFRIVDVVADGLSMTLTLRVEHGWVVSRGGALAQPIQLFQARST